MEGREQEASQLAERIEEREELGFGRRQARVVAVRQKRDRHIAEERHAGSRHGALPEIQNLKHI